MNKENILSKIELLQDLNTSFVKVVDAPAFVNSNIRVEYNEAGIKGYEDIILYFLKTIKNDFSLKDLGIFFNNLKDLTIKKENNLPISSFACYNAKDKVIMLSKEDYITDIYHELFHVASSHVNDDTLFSGFYQGFYDKKKAIGSGLTEGYTQKLFEEYFPNVSKCYEYEVYVSKIIEEIVEKDVMKKLYINADLKGLIYNLSRYEFRYDIIYFINDLDFVYKYRQSNKYKKENYGYLLNKLKSITYFLIRIYFKYLVNTFNNEYTIYEKLSSFLDSLYFEFNSYGINFEIITWDEAVGYIKMLLNNENMILLDSWQKR